MAATAASLRQRHLFETPRTTKSDGTIGFQRGFGKIKHGQVERQNGIGAEAAPIGQDLDAPKRPERTTGGQEL